MTPANLPNPGLSSAGRHLDRLEASAIAYLLLPVVLQIVGWLRWPYALPCVGLILWSFWRALRQSSASASPTLRSWLLIIAASLLWTAWSGLAPGFALNSDWHVRMSVLHDLTVGQWPVAYQKADSVEPVWLRLPMAYYLVPSLFGHFLGGAEQFAKLMLWGWTALGCAIFVALCVGRQILRGTSLGILLIVVFSGMDILGWLGQAAWFPLPGKHIEWWAGGIQYSSNTTLLFWVPNHALPGWLAAVLVWRHRESGLGFGAAAPLMLGVMAWAPLVAIGLLPFLVGATFRGQTPASWFRDLARPEVLVLLVPVLFVARLITFGAAGLGAAEGGAQVNLFNPLVLGGSLLMICAFAALEWGVLCGLLVSKHTTKWPLLLAAVVLISLPFFKFGPGNDLVMRGGIVALTLIMLAALDFLQSPGGAESERGVALLMVLLIGAFTPFQELYRGVDAAKPTFKSEGKTFVEIHATPWHYTARLSPGDWLTHALRDPQIMQSVVSAPRSQ